MLDDIELDVFKDYLHQPDHTHIYLTGCKFEGLHKYADGMNCKVAPKFVKGDNVVLPYTCSSTNIQIQIYKYE